MDYEDFESAGLTWEELQAIHDNYRALERKLREIGKDFVDEYRNPFLPLQDKGTGASD